MSSAEGTCWSEADSLSEPCVISGEVPDEVEHHAGDEHAGLAQDHVDRAAER